MAVRSSNRRVSVTLSNDEVELLERLRDLWGLSSTGAAAARLVRNGLAVLDLLRPPSAGDGVSTGRD